MGYQLMKADLIWNRALENGGEDARPCGDHALSSLLSVHGLIMNGGVFHAVELLSPAGLEAGINGFRFFSLDEVADLLHRARGVFDAGDRREDDELQLDREYSRIADDGILFERFLTRLQSSPESFSPL